jgi:5-methylcytosine-specific restriction endonuclease McrA
MEAAPIEESKSNRGWTAEIVLVVAVVGWILYELYGRTALEWIATWTAYIRIGGGILLILYVWWYARQSPEGFQTTMDLAKQMMADGSRAYVAGVASSGSGTTREKRNVSNLLKKKVAAGQSWKCGTCKTTLDETYEVDHVVPLFKGGSNDESNLKALCVYCHKKKTMAERLT